MFLHCGKKVEYLDLDHLDSNFYSGIITNWKIKNLLTIAWNPEKCSRPWKHFFFLSVFFQQIKSSSIHSWLFLVCFANNYQLYCTNWIKVPIPDLLPVKNTLIMDSCDAFMLQQHLLLHLIISEDAKKLHNFSKHDQIRVEPAALESSIFFSCTGISGGMLFLPLMNRLCLLCESKGSVDAFCTHWIKGLIPVSW